MFQPTEYFVIADDAKVDMIVNTKIGIEVGDNRGLPTQEV